jgi:hypothetical protein
VDHIDTTQYYGAGAVNELIHEALFPYPDGLAIVSKVAARRDPGGARLRFEGLDGLDRGDGVLDRQHAVHRAGPGQLWGLVVDEQQCRVFWREEREEMVGERIVHLRGRAADLVGQGRPRGGGGSAGVATCHGPGS